MINITLPNGDVRQYPVGTTGMDVAKSISDGLARVAVGIFVDENPYDLSRPIDHDASIRIVTFDNDEGKEIYGSMAHIPSDNLMDQWIQAAAAGLLQFVNKESISQKS